MEQLFPLRPVVYSSGSIRESSTDGRCTADGRTRPGADCVALERVFRAGRPRTVSREYTIGLIQVRQMSTEVTTSLLALSYAALAALNPLRLASVSVHQKKKLSPNKPRLGYIRLN